MLSREAVAAALALAGVRSGANVLDLTPRAGLTRAARAAAGASGRVDPSGPRIGPAGPPVRYGYAIGIWSDHDADSVVRAAEAARTVLAPYARVTLGSAGSLVALVDRLRSDGWTVLHGTSVPDADTDTPRGAGKRSDLALVAARAPQ
jgi:hypothetical protein